LQPTQADRKRGVVTKRKLSPIENERAILRLLERDDLPLTLAWRNQDHVRKWFLNTDVILEEKHVAWFERYKELDCDFVFIILAKELGNIPVGQVSLYDIDWNAGAAEFGRLLVGEPLAKRKGYAKDATRLILKYGFETLGLKNIMLEVKDSNEAAISIYRTIGFTETSKKNGLIVMTISETTL
jgi:RimJ/RimL family protein N-acetyltransferase